MDVWFILSVYMTCVQLPTELTSSPIRRVYIWPTRLVGRHCVRRLIVIIKVPDFLIRDYMTTRDGRFGWADRRLFSYKCHLNKLPVLDVNEIGSFAKLRYSYHFIATVNW